jgi:D-ornithine 4,5-aminomutase subunit alpha
MDQRVDDYEARRAHLKDLSDEQLKDKFWDLINVLLEPVLEHGRIHTSPSIERSVLMRMGFSSIEATKIVSMALEHEALGYGVGKVILDISENHKISIHEAGMALAEGNYWNEVGR